MQKELENKVIRALGITFRKEDNSIIRDIVSDMISFSLAVSNRTEKNADCLLPLIKRSCLEIYNNLGTEGLKNLSKSGKNMTFSDTYEELETRIIKGGFRLLS